MISSLYNVGEDLDKREQGEGNAICATAKLSFFFPPLLVYLGHFPPFKWPA
jgi:hypothetical protein